MNERNPLVDDILSLFVFTVLAVVLLKAAGVMP